MKPFSSWRVRLVGIGVLALATLSLAQGPGPDAPKVLPKSSLKSRDLSKLTVQQRLFYLSGQRCTEWLQRANRPDGRFVHGFVPALRVPTEGDDFLHQAGAAFALARAARFYGDDRSSAIARQALLTLLLETTTDGKNKDIRFTAAHPRQVNRLAAAALLILAIHELPSPADDLLGRADQLGNYLRGQINKDGSLRWLDDEDAAAAPSEGVRVYPGPALCAIVHSQVLRPASWKNAALRQACKHYHEWWRTNKNLDMLCWHTAAYAEAFVHSKEQLFADAVFEMNDWLCGLQYQQDPRRPHWFGGFMGWHEGKASNEPPNIKSAQAAESLAEACRVAKEAGDVQRHQRYRRALENCLQFLTSLQYTEASAQHFAEWYRPALVGAFHASHQDGNLRLDYAQHALNAFVQYLRHVAALPAAQTDEIAGTK